MAKYGIPDALQKLRPGAQWVLRGDAYSGLEWLDSSGTEDDTVWGGKPTEDSCNAKIADMDSDEPLRLLRVERDKKLADLDWEVIRHQTKDESIDSDLKVYMNALRDLPSTASPTIDSAGDLVASSFTWPTR